MYQKSGENNREERVAVAIDKDKGSQYALKWTVDHLITMGQSVTLIHVKPKSYTIPTPSNSFIFPFSSLGLQIYNTFDPGSVFGDILLFFFVFPTSCFDEEGRRRKCTSYFCCSRSSSAYGFANAVGSVVGFSDVNEAVARAYKEQLDAHAREVLLPFRCFCGRKAVSIPIFPLSPLVALFCFRRPTQG
ncbi:hypothetical protein Nepgr_009821 [Nepenthes gracilis]|uniref:RING-type E3 ubiquitin transferase n=1 Tax=Nepenthes gracilis TaxID=150966 RepID=A0AAD3XKS9_NEPGR|nr:hypothetical protein Nepgr_009821 [Nepenthes gracilis]